MSSQNETLTYIIEHLGIPMMCALGRLSKDGDQDAEVMARLLTTSVEFGVVISSKMNTPSDEEKAENLRFKLTSIAANVLSERFKRSGGEPSAEDIEGMKATIDSIIIFADHFSLNNKSQKYLSKNGLDDTAMVEVSQLATVEALLPVVAVMNNDELGLFTNVADRLAQEAEDLTHQLKEKYDLKKDVTGVIRQRVLGLLCNTFSTIYPVIMSDNRPLGDVWQEFDRKKSMVVMLLDFFMSGQNTVKTESSAAKIEEKKAEIPTKEEQKEDISAVVAPPLATKPSPPSVKKEPANAKPPILTKKADVTEEKPKETIGAQAGGSPLSFFKKKDEN